MNRYETILRHVGIWTLYAVYFFIVNKLGNSRLSILTVLISLPIFMFVYYGVSHSLNVYLYNRRYVGAILMLVFIYGVAFLTVCFSTYGWGGASGLYSDYFTARSNFDARKFMQSFLMLIGNFSIFAFLEYQYRLKYPFESTSASRTHGGVSVMSTPRWRNRFLRICWRMCFSLWNIS